MFRVLWRFSRKTFSDDSIRSSVVSEHNEDDIVKVFHVMWVSCIMKCMWLYACLGICTYVSVCVFIYACVYMCVCLFVSAWLSACARLCVFLVCESALCVLQLFYLLHFNMVTIRKSMEDEVHSRFTWDHQCSGWKATVINDNSILCYNIYNHS